MLTVLRITCVLVNLIMLSRNYSFTYVLIMLMNLPFMRSLYCLSDREVSLLHTKVDIVLTLGGDGTVLWVSALNVINLYL